VRRVLLATALIPRNVCVAILRAYRAVISPLYGDVCRYYPSCSQYALTAIQKHGAAKGIALGSWRLVRCHPWAAGGIDDVPEPHHHRYTLTRHGFVVPRHDHDALTSAPTYDTALKGSLT